ncbi:2-keto-4-pentenoate hydratase [Brevibacterium daeguense]|nr:fumarylacetoacetate hydrolase family protein [Brevibacterium daeguense]
MSDSTAADTPYNAAPDSTTSEAVHRSAEILHRATQRQEQLAELPVDAAPTTRAAAYAVQARLTELSHQPTVGWKIAATSAAGQRHINVDGPLGGRVLEDRVHPDGAEVSLTGNMMQLAEPEFVFVLGTSLAPQPEPYGAHQIMDAVSDLRLGIELPSTRFTDVTAVGALQLIADSACGHHFVLGPSVRAGWRELNLSKVHMSAAVNGPSGHREIAGRGANVLGNPVTALTWLVNELSELGIGLEAGTFVTTGTCSDPIPVRVGDTITADFDGLGTVTCALTA